MNYITRYIAKNKEEMNQLTKDFRSLGYMIITFSDKIRELEKGNHIIVITKERNKTRMKVIKTMIMRLFGGMKKNGWNFI